MENRERSILHKASGSWRYIAPQGGELFICPDVCSGQIKKHYLSALCASVVKEYFFWLLCLSEDLFQKIGDPGCGVCSDLLLLLAQDMK